jgi:predicted DNA-binding protein with PD1-like motif
MKPIPLYLFAALATLVACSPAPARAAGAASDTSYVERTFATPARFYALRLATGQDLRQELLRFARQHRLQAGFVASVAGSLTRTSIRYANQPDASVREGHFEIVSLSGTLTADGAHMHLSAADSTGATWGGHLMDGSLIYTTAEIVVGELSRARFGREVDSTYGYRELSVRRR